MPLPENWNNATIDVDPWALHSASGTALDAVKALGDTMNDIITRLNDLRLSWCGEAQQKADRFNSEWKALCDRLYGRKGHEEDGILNRFCDGLATAAVNYSRGERTVSDAFARFQGVLEGMTPKDFTTGAKDQDISDVVAAYRPKPPPPADPDAVPDATPQHDTPYGEDPRTVAEETAEMKKAHQHITSVDLSFPD